MQIVSSHNNLMTSHILLKTILLLLKIWFSIARKQTKNENILLSYFFSFLTLTSKIVAWSWFIILFSGSCSNIWPCLKKKNLETIIKLICWLETENKIVYTTSFE